MSTRAGLAESAEVQLEPRGLVWLPVGDPNPEWCLGRGVSSRYPAIAGAVVVPTEPPTHDRPVGRGTGPRVDPGPVDGVSV